MSAKRNEIVVHLDQSERKRLDKLEGVIGHILRSFCDAGEALRSIRDERLYRVEFSTFEAYCKERWGIVASRARQLIAAAAVVENLESVTTVTLTSERQARVLAPLPPEKQREALEVARSTAPRGIVTANHLKAVVNEREWGRGATSDYLTRYLYHISHMSDRQLVLLLFTLLPRVDRVLLKEATEAVMICEDVESEIQERKRINKMSG